MDQDSKGSKRNSRKSLLSLSSPAAAKVTSWLVLPRGIQCMYKQMNSESSWILASTTPPSPSYHSTAVALASWYSSQIVLLGPKGFFSQGLWFSLWTKLASTRQQSTQVIFLKMNNF